MCFTSDGVRSPREHSGKFNACINMFILHEGFGGLTRVERCLTNN